MKPIEIIQQEFKESIKPYIANFSEQKKYGCDAKGQELQSQIIKKISEFVENKKEEILLAWWAKYRFDPGKAVLVESSHNGEVTIAIREATNEEINLWGLKK